LTEQRARRSAWVCPTTPTPGTAPSHPSPQTATRSPRDCR
jgi:hypothetical protein